MRRKIPALVSLAFLMVSCGLNPFKSNPDYRYFQIKVDSVSVASPLRVFDPFQGGFGRLVGTASPLSASALPEPDKENIFRISRSTFERMVNAFTPARFC